MSASVVCRFQRLLLPTFKASDIQYVASNICLFRCLRTYCSSFLLDSIQELLTVQKLLTVEELLTVHELIIVEELTTVQEFLTVQELLTVQ